MKKKMILVLSLFFITGNLLAGCSFTREEKSYNVESYSTSDNLESGCFYVLHDNQYSKLYVGDASFDLEEFENAEEPEETKIFVDGEEKIDEEKYHQTQNENDYSDYSGSTAESTEEENENYYTRILWFGKDWNCIPTLYEGDQLVYCNAGELNEVFTIERFEYLGFTFGLTGFKETSTGRFRINVNSENYNIDKNSSSKIMFDEFEDESTVILEKIGETKLRESNMTNYGTIKGLKEDQKYKLDFYNGTVLHQLEIKADVRALGSMALYKTNDYDFVATEFDEGERNYLVSINIPAEFNTGYYFINGVGLFRYVKGNKFDEKTDFNVPNEMFFNEELNIKDDENYLDEKSDSVVINEDEYTESN